MDGSIICYLLFWKIEDAKLNIFNPNLGGLSGVQFEMGEGGGVILKLVKILLET